MHNPSRRPAQASGSLLQLRSGRPQSGWGQRVSEEDPAERPEKRRKKRRQPLKATAEALERSALYYLDRYDTASGHLRRLLMGKVALSARLYGTDPDAGTAAVERLIQRFLKAGVLDDARFARERVRSLRARGTSQAMVRARLRAKGVPTALIDRALEGEEAPGRDLAAALTYAKRRRLGPFRHEEREERRAKDLAALGRQGFDYETARRVIDCEDVEGLAAELPQN